MTATARTDQGRVLAEAHGVQPVDPAALSDVATDAILIAAPPGEAGCPGLAALAPILCARTVRPAWIGYLSTTGVYGDRQGRWVFETSAVNPQSAEAVRRVTAEQAWRDLGEDLGLTVATFRLPGIYGPGRSPFDRLRAANAHRLVKPGQVFSRIHVDDLAAGLLASMYGPRPGAIYHLCDDEPAPAERVTTFAAELLGIDPPPEEAFDAANLSPALHRFYAENKRVSNALAKAELGWFVAYPSYREGLAAVLAAEASRD